MRKSFVIFGALFLALAAAASAALVETATPSQPAPAVPFAAAVCCSNVTAIAPAADPQAIRESHSDAGYWYYQP
jgi:hypothetical protein